MAETLSDTSTRSRIQTRLPWLISLNRRWSQRMLYLGLDTVVTYLVWLCFVVLRREILEGHGYLDYPQQYVNAAVITGYWLLLYFIAGLYVQPFRRSRVQEAGQLLRTTLVGVLIIFFLIFLDDPLPEEKDSSVQRMLLATYFGMQFGGLFLVHMTVTTRTNMRIRSRKMGFPTLLVGSQAQAWKIFQDLEGMRRSLGYEFKGFISLDGSRETALHGVLKHYGDLSRLKEVILYRGIEDVIIALEPEEAAQVATVIDICEQTPALIKVVPGVYDYITGSVKVSHILGAPLIEIFPHVMRSWERAGKRAFDMLASSVALLLIWPLFLAIATAIRMDSDGPIFFRQERIGRGGQPFWIFKFRSMYVDAEKAGPALSSDHDPRVTKVGRWLRKTRLDELPQFWNVLIGDMSIVGPRPERQFYIDQIVKKAPHYRHLHKIRPGITSWGQVKYGYASTVEQMVERLQFDILYMENISLALDLKILLYTMIVIVEGRGK